MPAVFKQNKLAVRYQIMGLLRLRHWKKGIPVSMNDQRGDRNGKQLVVRSVGITRGICETEPMIQNFSTVVFSLPAFMQVIQFPASSAVIRIPVGICQNAHGFPGRFGNPGSCGYHGH